MSDAVRPVQTIEQVAAIAQKLGARHLSDYVRPTPAATISPSAN